MFVEYATIMLRTAGSFPLYSRNTGNFSTYVPTMSAGSMSKDCPMPYHA